MQAHPHHTPAYPVGIPHPCASHGASPPAPYSGVSRLYPVPLCERTRTIHQRIPSVSRTTVRAHPHHTLAYPVGIPHICLREAWASRAGCAWLSKLNWLNWAGPSGLESKYTFPKPWQIRFQVALFGHLAVWIWIKPFSNPNIPSHSHGRFASGWLHLDTVLSGSGSSHFRIRRHIPKAMADSLPGGFIWTPFCPDLDQAIVESSCTFPKLWQMCSQMALFRHLSVQIWIKPFLNPDTPSKSHGKFDSRWLHFSTLLSRSGSSYF